MPSLPAAIADLVEAVRPTDVAAAVRANARHATLAKPAGSLGELEHLGARLAAVARRAPPPVPSTPVVIVAAADHGVHAQGVTPWPQRITTTMVETICDGRAAVNAIARSTGADVVVLDVGCGARPAPHARLRDARVRAGTGDLAAGPAMSRAEASAAITAGAEVAVEAVRGGADLLVTGDMGIASTTASACLVAACTACTPEDVTGPGAGADDRTLTRKIDVVRRALARHRPDPTDPVGLVAALGGLEHAALVGVMLAGAASRVPVVLDGVITNAAALVAARLCPPVTGYLLAAHRSPEPGAALALDALGLSPLLDLRLRLGEGTGGLLAVPLVQAAARVLDEMALLADLSEADRPR